MVCYACSFNYDYLNTIKFILTSVSVAFVNYKADFESHDLLQLNPMEPAQDK